MKTVKPRLTWYEVGYTEAKEDMVHQVYRLTLDENGVEDIQDFTLGLDGIDAFNKAKRRKTVFAARLERLIMGEGVVETLGDYQS